MGQQFSAWGKGSGGSRMSQPKEDPRSSPMQRSTNRYASLYNQPGERSVSPSNQSLSGTLMERQVSSGSQSPTSTLERHHRAGSGGSRSMGSPNMSVPRDYRGPNRGPGDSSNERESAIQAVQAQMQTVTTGPFATSNFAKLPSNGPPGVAAVGRKPSDTVAVRSPLGPSDEEINRSQQNMEGRKVKEYVSNKNDLDRCINNFLDEYLHSCDDKVSNFVKNNRRNF